MADDSDPYFDFTNPDTGKTEKRLKNQTMTSKLSEGFSDSDKTAAALYKARVKNGFEAGSDPAQDGSGAGSGSWIPHVSQGDD